MESSVYVDDQSRQRREMRFTSSLLAAVYCLLVVASIIEGPTFTRGDTLPEIASSYSTYLSFNDYLTGVTFAAKEYYSQAINVSRFETSHDTSVVDLKNEQFYQWNNSNPTVCTKYQGVPYYLKPTYTRYHDYDQNYTLKGFTTIDRGINCTWYSKSIEVSIPGDSFVSNVTFSNVSVEAVASLNQSCALVLNDTALNITGTCNVTFAGATVCSFFNTTDTVGCDFGVLSNLTSVYNFSASGADAYVTANSTTDAITISIEIDLYLDAQSTALVRQTVNGTFNNETVEIDADLVDWTPSTEMQPALFALPTNCVDGGNYTAPNFTSTKNITAPITALDITKLLNNNYQVVLEEKLDNKTQALEWHKDASYESWETDYSVGGDIVQVYNTANQTQSFSFNSYTLACNSSNGNNTTTSAPLYQTDARRNIVYQILALHSVTGWVYETRTVRRMVDTDTYTATYTNGTTTYSVRLYLFVPGWKFPGRDGVDNNTIVPLAIESNTTVNGTTYSDAWDLFWYAPAAFPDSYTTADKIGCYPSAPSVYSATVSINVQEYGVTLQFDEYSIASQSYAAIGKFGQPADRGVIDYVAQTYTLVTGNSSCAKYVVTPAITSSSNVGPSTAYLVRSNAMGATQFLGVSSVRGVNASAWTTATSVTVAGTTFTQTTTSTYYWTRNAAGQNVPVRVVVAGKETDSANATYSRSYTTTVDWVAVSFAQPSPSVFDVSKLTCVTNATLPQPISNNLLPTARYQVPSVAVNATLPVIPTNFTMILNVAVSDTNNNAKSLSVKWTYDTVHLSEGVEVLNLDGTTGDRYIFCYTKSMGGSGYYSKNGMTQAFTVNPQLVNPLRNIGDSSLSATFYQTSMQSQYKLLNYLSYNGVSAENWLWTPNTTNPNTTSFYWYPSNWAVSSSVAGTRVPLALVNVDIYAVNGTSTTTTETWDILSYQPGVATFTSFGGACKPVVFDKFTDNYIAVGTLVVIVLICSVVAVILAFASLRYLKKRGYLTRFEAKLSHIRLNDQNPVNPNQKFDDDQSLMREEEL
ncbi:hypothetical protein DFA_05326 [Cavenderia fasciculata]|uniref:Transmembrane protein n=1 Tax=Cavenderia fasciculata TaxID=261658 RepID=F4PKX2_CACFS|nr:uncharacterized protein DFA_05326 [Cavenderia fasciculata]EGG23194.1 hypothetical protein DFA_05326 [Cavenderia fasciculata]|eukprot:XP_004361045.1 hypothetical protein DFA_05326 [Cavenderia fasciculata]